MVIFLLVLSLFIFYPVTPLTCHSCSGVAGLPSTASKAIEGMNLTNAMPIKGNCKGKTGSDVCTNGLFCYKKTVTYAFQYSGLSIKWDTFTKGCASVRLDNAAAPTNTCYDISTTNKDGYTEKTRHCYCQTDFCNSSVSLLLSSVYIISIIYFIK